MIERVQSWLAALRENEQMWIVEVFVVVLLTVTAGLVAKALLARLLRRAEKTRNPWDDTLVDAIRAPLQYLIWLVGLSWAANLARVGTEATLLDAAETVRQVGVVLLITWFLVRFVRGGERNFLRAQEDGEPVDQTTVLAMGKLLRVSILITAALVLLQSLGYSISGVLAFGGIGGLAVGFAARDLLANFFGGLMIYMDRPFAVGEWVRSPDREIEGTVEDIGWRLTRIRTFDRRPLYVPNSIFTQIAVENPSRMEHRRIFETVGIRYDDADKMADVVRDVKQMLLDHPDIETDERVLIVNFNTFAASSLDFFIYTFTKTTNWVEFHEIKQDVLLRAIQIIEGHGAQCAFPTSTLHIPDGVAIEQRLPKPEPENA